MSVDARYLDEQNTRKRANILNIDYFDTSNNQVELYKNILDLKDLYAYKAVPLIADSYNIKFGITNNTSQSTISYLKQRFSDQNISFYLISDSGYREIMKRYDPPKEIVYKEISISESDQDDQFNQVSKTLESVRADDMLAYIVKQSFKLHASDIHLESNEGGARIRFRVDGVLHPIASLSKEKYHQLISSLASAANISTNTMGSQTGHINRNYYLADNSEVIVNLRVETVQAVNGMDCVLRLFNMDPELMKIDRLDLDESQQEVIRDIINHPNGLVLFVGPTGSGKSTTLYTIINELNHPERKIITLEDPVEYNVPGVTQIPVESKGDEKSFANSLRAVLRLDPDVVMIGEIRDTDTAKTALQSSLTGHLVLSTYHASSSSAALTRLLDSIGENPLFISAIRLITAQRLLRKLDDDTKIPYQPDEKTKKWINSILSSLPDHVKKPNVDNLQLFKPGSSDTNPFGYSGQFAVRELLIMNEELEMELKKPINSITSNHLEEIAVKNGMVTIMQQGLLSAIGGKTSLEEVTRVIG